MYDEGAGGLDRPAITDGEVSQPHRPRGEGEESRVVPNEFANFFLAMAGAGAALIGLLFVAVSIRPERTFSADAPRERQAVATSAFSALVNAFFISSAALLPKANLGVTAIIMATLGLQNAASTGLRLLTHQVHHYRHDRLLVLRLARAAFLAVVSLILHGFEFAYARLLIVNERDVGAVFELATLILFVYGVGLTRAWQLLGAPRGGLLSWLNPLNDLEEERPTPATNKPEAGAPPPQQALHQTRSRRAR